jgi:hypothetical protein
VNAEQSTELRKPFPDGVVGTLPKPYKKDSPKGNCQVCGGYHGLPAAHLDFVGHAAVTDRLLTVDPEWTWEPMGVDPQGLPVLDRDGNLWIRLTVCGVTRVGVGDGPSMKEKIGDAVRNAAMRFGVALALWTKDELESGATETKAVDGHPDDQVRLSTFTFRQAKNRIYKAFTASGLGAEAAKAATEAAWLLGESNISEQELDQLIARLELGRPAGPVSLLAALDESLAKDKAVSA